jgi:hypothetical protein
LCSAKEGFLAECVRKIPERAEREREERERERERKHIHKIERQKNYCIGREGE